MEGATSSAASEAILQTLTRRGWCFSDSDQVKALISLQFILNGGSSTVDLVQSELASMDLRSIGGKSLPDVSLLRNSSHLTGPKVLQVSSVRDISRSSVDDNSGNSHKRLLRLNLTDGHSEITAIEYSHVPSIPNDIVPGTKVLLENKAPIHCGIMCLNPKVITVLGGVVQSLYEEWQMNQKYSGFSRSSLQKSKESDGDIGPPPFEKLQINSLSRQAVQPIINQHSASTSKSYKPAFRGNDPKLYDRPIAKLHDHGQNVDNLHRDRNVAFNAKVTEESASNSEARPREVIESVPVQNQAAAQKLLQKMSQPNREYQSRGRKYRGKSREEDTPVFTLDEYQRRKAGANPSVKDPFSNVNLDEDLARQLQEQFDLENHHVQHSQGDSEAERLRMSMFNFQRNDDRGYDGDNSRGGGRGRGRGRRRGRGRGR